MVVKCKICVDSTLMVANTYVLTFPFAANTTPNIPVVMWVLLIGKDSSAITMAVMWVAYLFNSVYGYYNWKKLAAKNKENK